MSKLLAYVHADRCRVLSTGKSAAGSSSNGSANGSGRVVINSSVGLRSTNIPFDVTNIQNALNRLHIGYGGPEKPLVPDGVCGSKTVDAIQKFQLRHFGWQGADGKINPNGETLAKINEQLGKPPYTEPQVYPPDSPVVSEVFSQTVNVYAAEARRWVNEARMELMALEPFIDMLDDSSEEYRRLNNIFAIGQAPNRRQTLKKILHVYDDMERAFQHRDSSGNGVFELYRGAATGTSRTGSTIAFTTSAGFYRGEIVMDSRDFGPTRVDKVYIMPSGMVIWVSHDLNFFTSVLIHELAHFVGGWHSVGTIEDWYDEGTLLERLRAANCYQMYAEAVHFRSPAAIK
jgi:hypothetical protein